MRTTIDRAGRVVVPKSLRDRLGLVAGAEVELSESGGQLVLSVIGPAITLQEREGRRVFVAQGEGTGGLTDDDVQRLVDESRQWPRG
jgi:AbrB family looped-hinge helix DNA binding protein